MCPLPLTPGIPGWTLAAKPGVPERSNAVNASKEEAQHANRELEACASKMDLLVPGDGDRNELKWHLARIQLFLEAAERKLPTEAALAKYRRRKAKA